MFFFFNHQSFSYRERVWILSVVFARDFERSVFLLIGGGNPFLNISQIGAFPQVGVKIKDIWKHHLVFVGGSSIHNVIDSKKSSLGSFPCYTSNYWRDLDTNMISVDFAPDGAKHQNMTVFTTVKLEKKETSWWCVCPSFWKRHTPGISDVFILVFVLFDFDLHLPLVQWHQGRLVEKNMPFTASWNSRIHCPWKMMVGRWLSFWDCLFF